MPSPKDSSPLRERLGVAALRLVPKNAYSDLVGFAARRRVPRPLRAPLYRAFAKRVGAAVDEAEQPLAAYSSFGDFFARKLRGGLRPIDPRPERILAPCDGTISHAGTITDGRLVQAKGIDYTLDALLGEPGAAARFHAGAFVTIYLAPRDYHRVHAPLAGAITGFRRIPGTLFPVNPPAVRHVAGLFTRNERLVTYLATPLGEVALVMVGATGVGSIRMAYDDRARSRLRRRRLDEVVYGEPKPIERGAELGAFHLGSTVVLVFQEARVIGVETLLAGRSLRCGEPLLLANGAGEVAA